MKKSQLKEAIKAEIKSVLSEELEKFQMTYKGDPVHIKVQGFGGNEEGAKDTVLFVNVGGMGKRHKSTQNALEKRLGLLDKKVDKIMFTDKDNTSKEIKDISKDDFEIKSVLSEEIQVGDIVTLGGDSDELEVIDSRRMFGSDMMAYRVKKVDGTKFNANVDFPEIGDETVEYSANQLRPARMMNEVYQTNSKMSQIVSLFQDMMGDEYDGVDYREVLNMVLKAIDDDYKAAEREGEKFSRIREDEDLKEDRRRVVDYDNRDDRTTELFLDNGDSVEVDVIELYDNLKENNPTFSDIREDEDEAPAGDKKIEKAAKGADKSKDDYAKLAGKDNSEISKASSIVKEKAKKAKEGDKEALSWLKSNQKVIKAYNDLKK